MEDNGQGATVPRSTAQGDDAEGLDMGMAIDGASHHDNLGVVFGFRELCEGSCGSDLGELAGSLDDEGCWPDMAQRLHADGLTTAREPSTVRFQSW